MRVFIHLTLQALKNVLGIGLIFALIVVATAIASLGWKVLAWTVAVVSPIGLYFLFGRLERSVASRLTIAQEFTEKRVRYVAGILYYCALGLLGVAILLYCFGLLRIGDPSRHDTYDWTFLVFGAALVLISVNKVYVRFRERKTLNVLRYSV